MVRELTNCQGLGARYSVSDWMDHGGPFSTPVVNVIRTTFAATGVNVTIVVGPVLARSAAGCHDDPSADVSTRNPRGNRGPVAVLIGAPGGDGRSALRETATSIKAELDEVAGWRKRYFDTNSAISNQKLQDSAKV